ncbi:uncharacterized protein LOC141812998 [Curcuma longa]|uniref:uncharacterized protein LOC141812998 n=1 Tax=Curcuma longa TaxID=136217 RepID=UPI003D9E85B8
MPEAEPEGMWKVFVDGSATKQGSGVDVLLVSPQGEMIQLSIQLSFRASNNEAEYESLLAGLQAAKRMGATRVQVHSDSQLVSQQIEGNFKVKNDRLRRYAEAFTKLKAEFTEVNLQKIPRADNSKVDELAIIASSLTEWVAEESIMQFAFIA